MVVIAINIFLYRQDFIYYCCCCYILLLLIVSTIELSHCDRDVYCFIYIYIYMKFIVIIFAIMTHHEYTAPLFQRKSDNMSEESSGIFLLLQLGERYVRTFGYVRSRNLLSRIEHRFVLCVIRWIWTKKYTINHTHTHTPTQVTCQSLLERFSSLSFNSLLSAQHSITILSDTKERTKSEITSTMLCVLFIGSFAIALIFYSLDEIANTQWRCLVHLGFLLSDFSLP